MLFYHNWPLTEGRRHHRRKWLPGTQSLVPDKEENDDRKSPLRLDEVITVTDMISGDDSYEMLAEIQVMGQIKILFPIPERFKETGKNVPALPHLMKLSNNGWKKPFICPTKPLSAI